MKSFLTDLFHGWIIKMNKRKKKFFDNAHHFRVFRPLFAVSIAAALLLLALAGYSTYRHQKRIIYTISELNQAIETEDNIIMAYLEYTGRTVNDKLKISAIEVKTDHEKSMTTLKKYVLMLQDFMDNYICLILLVITLIFIQTVFHFIYSLKASANMSGPLKIFISKLQDMLDERDTSSGRLEKMMS
jgi:hypothetical protein